MPASIKLKGGEHRPRSISSAAARNAPTSCRAQPKPEWLKVRAPGSENYLRLKGLMRGLGLHTVCEEANCPNIGECWHHGTATFMILGDTCTRVVRLLQRHARHAEAARRRTSRSRSRAPSTRWSSSYVVVTSVDRDDLAGLRRVAFRADDRARRARASRRAASKC